MTVLISRSPEVADWALLKSPESRGRQWGQVMRVPGGFIVDVHDGSNNDFAERVFRGELGDYPRPSGKRPCYPFELWSQSGVANVLWCWINGSLPDGSARTMNHMISACFDHGY